MHTSIGVWTLEGRKREGEICGRYKGKKAGREERKEGTDKEGRKREGEKKGTRKGKGH